MVRMVGIVLAAAICGGLVGAFLHARVRPGLEAAPGADAPPAHAAPCENCVLQERQLVTLTAENQDLQDQVAKLKADSASKPTGDVAARAPIGTEPLPENLRLADPTSFKSWAAFYAHAKAWKFTHDELTEAVLVRVCTELALSDRESRVLRSLTLGEQEEISLYATAMAKEKGGVDKAIHDEDFVRDVLSFREDLRFHDNMKFESQFSADARKVIDEHLRSNSEMTLRIVKSEKADAIMVEGGVGR